MNNRTLERFAVYNVKAHSRISPTPIYKVYDASSKLNSSFKIILSRSGQQGKKCNYVNSTTKLII